MNDSKEPEQDWYANAFNALYPIVYAHRTVAAAAPEAAFAASVLDLHDGDHVLDLCCGNGRHMVHLLEHTPHVYGLDYSDDLLAVARKQIGCSRLVRGDMRALPFAGCFDAVANFFTSFGYFATTPENMRVARCIARVLKPGGRFFMDYLNPEQVRDTLVPVSKREESGYVIEEHRWIDWERKRVNKRMRVTHGGVVVMESGESVRMYALDELRGHLEDAGLRVEHVHGDYDGTAWSNSAPRMLLVGRRKDGVADGEPV